MALTNKQKAMAEYIRGTRATAPAEIADQHPEYYNPWVAGEAVSVGDRRAYNSLVYEVIQAHTTQTDWTPDEAPALWKRVYTEEWPEWVQPAGGHDAYAKGAKVMHKSDKWTSDVDNNVWEPGVYGWTKYTA